MDTGQDLYISLSIYTGFKFDTSPFFKFIILILLSSRQVIKTKLELQVIALLYLVKEADKMNFKVGGKSIYNFLEVVIIKDKL